MSAEQIANNGQMRKNNDGKGCRICFVEHEFSPEALQDALCPTKRLSAPVYEAYHISPVNNILFIFPYSDELKMLSPNITTDTPHAPVVMFAVLGAVREYHRCRTRLGWGLLG